MFRIEAVLPLKYSPSAIELCATGVECLAGTICDRDHVDALL